MLVNISKSRDDIDKYQEVQRVYCFGELRNLPKTGVAVQNIERSRTSKVSGSCQRLAVHGEG